MCGIALILEYVSTTDKNTNDTTNTLLCNEIEENLRKRGPDHFEWVKRTIKSSSTNQWKLHFGASVLHLRGDTLVPQPVLDSDGNILCWNGEIFGGINIPDSENDTLYLANTLQRIAATCMEQQQQIEDVIQQCIIKVIQKIQGPFSFVWFHAATQRLFFGHDRFGRRSLLYHLDSSISLQDEDGCVLSAQHSQALHLTHLCLSSMAVSTPTTKTFCEVPATGIYSLHLTANPSELHLEYEAYPALFSQPPVSIVDKYNCGLPTLYNTLTTPSLELTAQNLLLVLSNAVGVRVRTIPAPSTLNSARVAVLFSGGLDSVVLAALTHFHVPASEPIDLLNVCFDLATAFGSPDRQAAEISFNELRTLFPTRLWRFIRIDIAYTPDIQAIQVKQIQPLVRPCETLMDLNIGSAFWFLARGQGNISSFTIETPALPVQRQKCAAQQAWEIDVHGLALFEQAFINEIGCPVKDCRRKASGKCTFRICSVCCYRVQALLWTSPTNGSTIESLQVLLNVSTQKVQQLLVAVKKAQIDTNVVCCRNHKRKTVEPQNLVEIPSSDSKSSMVSSSNDETYTTSARVLLIGIGADEQLGGYGRHKTAYLKEGTLGLRSELALDLKRIWKRNLGRDDRIVASHGKEGRYPFLDEQVVTFLASVPIEYLCDFTQPRGEGDKRLLRLAARIMGLNHCTTRAKQAIQFGTRITKYTEAERMKSSGTTKF